MAVANYHDTYGCLPPAFVADSDGKPMHSWRVLLLPFLERADIYKRYRFDEPWNGPNNSKLASEFPHQYRCPSHGDESNRTSYVVIAGAETAFPVDSSVGYKAITDGTSNTILVAEIANSGIHWMEPRDLSFTEMSFKVNAESSSGISSVHKLGAYVLFADGSVKFLGMKTPDDTVRGLLTIEGEEIIRSDF